MKNGKQRRKNKIRKKGRQERIKKDDEEGRTNR